MATQDQTGKGLLSRVAKIVRSTTDWADLDVPDALDSAQDSISAKEALKSMIERKRHNDAVRRREFDHLRKLRQASVVVKSQLAASLSAFRSSTGYSDLDERALTLKKIDDIEAQMSRQWWKGRATSAQEPVSQPGSGSLQPAAPHRTAQPASAASELRDAYASTRASDLLPGVMDDVPTQSGTPTGSDFMASVPAASDEGPSTQQDFRPSISSVFSVSKMMSVNLSGGSADPLLEEAAIHYANGDDAGAESCLLAAMQDPQAAPEQMQAWAGALFDIYRCTGRQEPFDQLAMEYAQRFATSAPVWVCVPELLGRPLQTAPRAAGGLRTWRAPGQLSEAEVRTLAGFFPLSQPIWCMDWQPLRGVAAPALPNLALLVASWCQRPLRLRVQGLEALEQALRAHTVNGDAHLPQAAWHARLDVLRLLQRQDEFEAVAMDYCVTYEISPPTWAPLHCVLEGEACTTDELGLPEAKAPSTAAAGTTPELAGEMLGDAEAVTQGLTEQLGGRSALRVSCQRLVRMDFSAAGSLLNWAAQMESQGVRVDLLDVPRQVAAFFALIGIDEHATIVARSQ
jgi:ABC-type transporter Mla MlaB component